LELLQGEFALQAVPFFTVANLVVERRQEIKSYVRGLKILGVGLRDVMHE
jgi:hypothetical protein